MTKNEVQAFDYFRQHAAFHLSGLFGCAVWNHLVLQGSHQEPTILRASIAVGAIYEARQAWMPSAPMTSRDRSAHGLAIAQYNKAIVDLRSYIERLNGKRNDAAVCVVLMTCLLFVSFEMMQGASCTVNAHLVKGLKVLSDHVGTKDISRLQQRTIARTKTTQPDIDDLTEVFIRLDADSTMFRRRSPYIRSEVTAKLPLEIDIPSAFSSVKEAKVYLDSLSSLAYACRGELLKMSEQILLAAGDTPRDWARHYCIAYAKARQLRPGCLPQLAQKRQCLLNAFDKWASSLTALQSPNRRAVIHLQVTKFVPYFLISTLQDTCEIICDRFDDEFQEVVDLAAEFMDTSVYKPFENYKFVPESGILASLYLVGVKCRNPYIRRKANGLLLRSTVQEGLWTGCIYGQSIKRLIEMEESRARTLFGLREDEEVTYVPEEARFSDVVMDTGDDDQIRDVRIICARLMDEESQRVEIVEDVFSLRNPETTVRPPSLWQCSYEA